MSESEMKTKSGVLPCRSFHNFVINQNKDTPLVRNRHNSRLGETWTLDFWMNPALPYLKQAVLCAHATTHNKHFTTFLIVVESVCVHIFSKKKNRERFWENRREFLFFQCPGNNLEEFKSLVCFFFLITILCNCYIVMSVKYNKRSRHQYKRIL